MALHISVARMLRCCSALLQGKADSSTTTLFTVILMMSGVELYSTDASASLVTRFIFQDNLIR